MDEEKIKIITDTQDSTSELDPSDIEANKVVSIFSYISFLFILPLLLANNSKYAKFHANQGLVLFIAEVICGVIVSVVSFVLGIIPFIGAIVANIIGAVVGIVSFLFMVLGIVNAITGKAKKLPIIGNVTIIK